MKETDNSELRPAMLKAKRDQIRAEADHAASLVGEIRKNAPTSRAPRRIRRPGLSKQEYLERMKLLRQQARLIGGGDEQ